MGIKAFLGSDDLKKRALFDAKLARMGGHFYGWGHYWHPEHGGKCRGNVSGAILHQYLKDGQVEQDLPAYWEPVMGIPWTVGELLDVFFSALCCHPDKELHQHWAEQALGAVRPGADLSQVADKMAAYMLETPDWLAAYADEKGAHQVGLMSAFVTLRLNGINQDKRIKDFYYDHMHKLQRHQLDIRHAPEGAARAAMQSLCTLYMEQRRGPLGYFMQHAVEGSAAHRREQKTKRWVELSQIFLQMIEDC